MDAVLLRPVRLRGTTVLLKRDRGMRMSDTRTRRGLLAGAVAGVAAGALVPASALAADGDNVVLAGDNVANNPTVLRIEDSGQAALELRSRTDEGTLKAFNDASDGAAITANGEGYGLIAVGRTQAAIYATSDDALALKVLGTVELSRSGVITVPARTQSVSFSAGYHGVLATTKAFATLQSYRSNVWVTAAVPNAATQKITIWLNRTVSVPMSVAWTLLD